MGKLNEYCTMPLREMPQTAPFREACMIQPRSDSCTCWYHAVNWREANAIAIQVVRMHGPVLDLDAVREALPDLVRPTELEWAIWSLFADPIVISNPKGGASATYTNGQHRVQAMMDQGVEVALIERNPPLDPRVLAQAP